MSKQKRVNKSKGEIVSELHQVEDAKRRRALIKDVIFPYLNAVNESIGYSKIFLQSFSGLMEQAFEESRKLTTVGMLADKMKRRLENLFKLSDKGQKQEYERYMALIAKLHDISIQDFSYAAEMPRYIDGYMTRDTNKQPITTINVDELLG
jgi:hypothetical protein